jgi:hypothetical protein
MVVMNAHAANATLIQTYASELARRYRSAKPGDVGMLLRQPRAGFEAAGLVDLTFAFDSPDSVADFIAPLVTADSQGVVDDVRKSKTAPGMVRVVVVSDGTVSLIMVPTSTLRDAT